MKPLPLLLALTSLLPAEPAYQIFVPIKKGLLTFEAQTGAQPTLTQTAHHQTNHLGAAITLSADQSRLYMNVRRDQKPSSYVLATHHLSPAGTVTHSEELDVSMNGGELVLSPKATTLMASNYGSGRVAAYAVNKEGKVLAETTYRDNERRFAHDIVFHPHQPFVYVPFVKEFNEIYQFRLDEQESTLTPLDPLMVGTPSPSGPRHGEAHPSGQAVYFSNEQELGLSAYRVSKDGTLSLIEVEPSQVPNQQPEGYSASFLEISPNAPYLFQGIRDKTESNLDRLVTYRIHDDYSVSQVASLPFPAKIPWGARVTPDGQYLIVTSVLSTSLHLYRINPDGTLTERATAPLGHKVMNFAVRASP